MSFQREIAAQVLPLLTDAGWIKSSFVSETDIKVNWTPRGKKRTKEVLHLAELPRAINGMELAFMVYLAQFYFDNPWRAKPSGMPET